MLLHSLLIACEVERWKNSRIGGGGLMTLPFENDTNLLSKKFQREILKQIKAEMYLLSLQ